MSSRHGQQQGHARHARAWWIAYGYCIDAPYRRERGLRTRTCSFFVEILEDCNLIDTYNEWVKKNHMFIDNHIERVLYTLKVMETWDFPMIFMWVGCREIN